MLRVLPAQPRLLVDSFKSHEPEQPSNPPQVDLFALSSQSRGHPFDALARMLRVLLVKYLNHQHVPCRFPAALSVVEARTVESQKLALSAQGKFSVFRIQRLATVRRRFRQASQIF